MKKYSCKKIMIFIWATVFVCVLTTAAVAQKLGEPFDLKLGQEVTVQNTGLTIKFKSVDEDSRCPEGARCEWEGNAKVTLQVLQTGFSPNTISLNTSPRYPRQATYSDYILRLVALSPYRKYKEKIKPEDYVVTLIVTEREDKTIRRSQ